MAFRRSRRSVGMDPFLDLLFNTILIFAFLFLIAIIFISPPADLGNVELKAEYIVSVKWPDNSEDDVDTWVQDPEGRILWFRNTDTGFMHLDRDDRGLQNDMIVVDGSEILNPLNQEIVTIRKLIPGEYIVNLHYYKSISGEPVTAEVSVSKVNPSLEILYYGKVLLRSAGAEATVVRFNLDREGRVGNLNTLPKALVVVEAA